MSSHICSSKLFNSIEKTATKELKKKKSFFYSMRGFFGNIEPAEMEKSISSLLDEVRKINVLCVMLQYKHHYIGTLDKEIKLSLEEIQDKTSFKIGTVGDIYNAAGEINYQIETQHLTELRELSELETVAMEFLSQLKLAAACTIADEVVGKY
jgi:hypothetical protein